MSLLNIIEIQKEIQTPIFLDVLESTSSTNDYFKNKPVQHEFEFCFTEHQTQGRGRLGRTWLSPSGVNLMFSCRWQIPSSLHHLGGLSSCVSLSLISALKYLNIPDLMCKWPNDLFYQNKKLAGILIELHASKNKITEAVIGIGLNVNMQQSDFNSLALDRPLTSLQLIVGETLDRNILSVHIINSLVDYLTRFSHDSWTNFMHEWADYDYLKDKEVSIPLGQEQIKGKAYGVDATGCLLVLTPDNHIIPCQSGEVLINPG